jgi:hypothetical protein
MGVVTGQKIIDDRVYITCSIDEDCSEFIKKGENRLSIGFSAPRDRNVALNTKYEVNEISITSDPVHNSCYVIVENSNDIDENDENILIDNKGNILKNNLKIYFSSDAEITMETPPNTATTITPPTNITPPTGNTASTIPPVKPTAQDVINEMTTMPADKQKFHIEEVVKLSETLKNTVETERKDKEMYLSKIKEFKKNEAINVSKKLEKLKEHIPPNQYANISKLGKSCFINIRVS